MEEALYYFFETEEQDYPSILPLETKLFDSASIENLLQGMLYVLPLLYNENLFVRYIATGSYRGFLPQILDKIQQKTNIPPNRIFPWEVYTQKDFLLHRKSVTPKDLETTYTRKIGSQDSFKSNKKRVLPLLNQLKPKLDETYAILFIHKAKVNSAKPTHRYHLKLTSQTPLKGRYQPPSVGGGWYLPFCFKTSQTLWTEANGVKHRV